ncbi:MAG: FecR family protein, partial [Chryseobacterium sp.]
MDSLANLLNQESFLNYCFNRNDGDIKYWKKWLEDHPEQRAEIEKLRQLAILMAEGSRARIIDGHFAELQQKIEQTYTLGRFNTRPLWKKWTVVAAASIAVVISGVIFLYIQNADVPLIAASQDVLPGSNNATLVLSNGKTVDLSGEDNGVVASQEGIRVTKTSSGEIVYASGANTQSSDTEIPANILRIPRGGEFQVTLSDGTKVWLNSGTSLKYPVTFTKDRTVELTGEAYFEVAPDKHSTFTVVSKGQKVKVLGTHFNINSYPEELAIKTTLVEGSVEVTSEKFRKRIIPGEMAIVGKMGMEVAEVDVEDMISWKNGYFKFNEDLESTMRKLSRWYDVDIVYADKESIVDEPILFGGKISRAKKLSSVLKIIESTKSVKFK